MLYLYHQICEVNRYKQEAPKKVFHVATNFEKSREIAQLDSGLPFQSFGCEKSFLAKTRTHLKNSQALAFLTDKQCCLQHL